MTLKLQMTVLVLILSAGVAAVSASNSYPAPPDTYGLVALAGDFNGDGCDTVSIYRPSEARFYIINELGTDNEGLGAADFSFLCGNPDNKPPD